MAERYPSTFLNGTANYTYDTLVSMLNLCSKSNKRLIKRELASIRCNGWFMVNVKWDINRKCDTIVISTSIPVDIPGSYSTMAMQYNEY